MKRIYIIFLVIALGLSIIAASISLNHNKSIDPSSIYTLQPANLGNTQNYLINPVFPAHTIASQYGFVTEGNGRVFIGGLYESGNGYLAGAKGAAVVASMLAYQPLTEYDYYLYITSPSPINVGGAVKTDSATVLFLASMLNDQSSINKSMYFLGDVGLEGYMYSTGVVYQRVVQLYEGGIYYLVVPYMMALAEGNNFQMAEQFAKQHNITLITAEDIPQMYEILTNQMLPKPSGYLDLQFNITSGYYSLSKIYGEYLSLANMNGVNQDILSTAEQYWSEAEALASSGNFTAFYIYPNPAISAITLLVNATHNTSILYTQVNEAVNDAYKTMNLWKLETAAEAEYLLQSNNVSLEVLANAWAGLSLSIEIGPTITPYGLYSGLYNMFVSDVYSAEYVNAITGAHIGNITLLTQIYDNPNVLYDYGFLANYYAKLAIALRDYYLNQLNQSSRQLIYQNIDSYMKNLTIILENAAAYYDGPSVVGYILMKAGETTSNLNLLYYSMGFGLHRIFMNLYPILSPWASPKSRGIAPLILLRPFSGITPTHLLPVGVRKRWGNPHILR